MMHPLFGENAGHALFSPPAILARSGDSGIRREHPDQESAAVVNAGAKGPAILAFMPGGEHEVLLSSGALCSTCRKMYIGGLSSASLAIRMSDQLRAPPHAKAARGVGRLSPDAARPGGSGREWICLAKRSELLLAEN